MPSTRPAVTFSPTAPPSPTPPPTRPPASRPAFPASASTSRPRTSPAPAPAGVEPGAPALLAVGGTPPATGSARSGPADAVDAARGYLFSHGAALADPSAYETARIEAGVPRFGVDVTPENFPGETG